MIRILNHTVGPLLLSEPTTKAWLRKVIQEEGYQLIRLDINIVDNERIQQINKEFLEHDYTTDVISFDMGSTKNTVFGEIYIGLPHVRENAEKFSKSFSDELLRVMVHGLLHLIGYEDSDKKSKYFMHLREDMYLKQVADCST